MLEYICVVLKVLEREQCAFGAENGAAPQFYGSSGSGSRVLIPTRVSRNRKNSPESIAQPSSENITTLGLTLRL